MSTVLMVNATSIKEYTFIDENVDEKYLRIAVKEAQELRIRHFVGTGLYNELITQITNSTLTALNTTLLDTYIAPCLRYWTILEASPFMAFKLTNKNIVKKTSTNSGSLDANELNLIISEIENRAKYYAKRLIDYLVQNNASYPLYYNPGNGTDTIYPEVTAYDCGIWLGVDKDYKSLPSNVDIDYGRKNNC